MVRVTGVDRLTRKLRKLQGDAFSAATMTDALWDAAEPVERTASDLAPKRTGALSRGVHRDVMDREPGPAVGVGIGRNEFYGLFSEVGTVKEPARPWLRPAFDTHRRAVVAAFTARLRREIAKAVR